MHSGQIFVESNYGAGTKFTVKLPVNILDPENREENTKKVNSSIDECVERIKIEFSDIYN